MPPKESVPGRPVRCYHCKGELTVPMAARSASCPLCHRGLILDDLLVRDSGFAGKLTTCGKVLIEKKGRAVTRQIEACQGVDILGAVEAKVVSYGTVYLGKTARVKGDFEAPEIVVERGAVLEGMLRIGPGVAR
ncbi:MAG TPA: polymer-forming cytoskeletal protein [Phycisphaerales bacterium]|nr:polymer-forming cytoskeletal protein [Phycisphaerales bacterium]